MGSNHPLAERWARCFKELHGFPDVAASSVELKRIAAAHNGHAGGARIAATPGRMMSEAGKISPASVALFEAIMKAKPHPEQGIRA